MYSTSHPRPPAAAAHAPVAHGHQHGAAAAVAAPASSLAGVPSGLPHAHFPVQHQHQLQLAQCNAAPALVSAAAAPTVASAPSADYLSALASLCTCFMSHVWPSPSLAHAAASAAAPALPAADASIGAPNAFYPQAPPSPPAEPTSPEAAAHAAVPCISPASAPSTSAAAYHASAAVPVAHHQHQMQHPATLAPTVPFATFAHQLIAITRTPAETVIVGLKYLFMLRQRFPGDIANAGGSEYRLFVTALMLAHKMLDDKRCSMQAWAKITSIPASELSQMEFEFLSALDYNLHVSKEAYHTWCTQLERFLAIARKDAAQAQAQAQAQAHAHAKAQAKAAAIAAGYYTVQQPSAVAQAAAIAAAQQHAYQQQQQQFKYAQYAHSTAARPPSPVELPMATFGGFAQQCAMAVASDNRPP